MRSCKCKNNSKIRDTQEDPGRKMDSLGVSSLGSLPTSGRGTWFPKITEGFFATYQANYGFSNDSMSSSTAKIQDVNSRDAEELLQEKPQTH